MNRQPKRMLKQSRKKYAARSSPGSVNSGKDGWMSAYTKSDSRAKKSFNNDNHDGDSDSDDSPVALGCSRKGNTSKMKPSKYSKKSIGKKSWNDGCSSDGSDSSSSDGASGSESDDSSVEVKKKKGRERPTTKPKVVAQLKKGEGKAKSNESKKISSASFNKTNGDGAGVRKRTAPRPEIEQEVSQVAIPDDITTVDQLKWYHIRLPREGRSREILQPCRVLSRSEAVDRKRRLGKDNSAKNGKNTVIQYLNYPDIDDGMYKCVGNNDLIPFGYKARDGVSTTFNDDYLQRYMQQERKTTNSRRLEAIKLFVMRVFNYARETERKEREQVVKESQDYHDDTSSSDDSDDDVDTSHKRVSDNKRVQFEVVEQADDDDVGDEADDEMDELDMPYTQAINFDPDDFGPVGVSKEPIRPGDVVEYYSPIFVAGDPRGLRQATVLSVDPEEETPLVLSNGEVLPNTTKVKRIKVISEGELLDHPGIFRPILRFRLIKRGNATAADGIAMETARFGKIMQKNMTKLKEKARAEGFAPMDMLVSFKGAKDADSTPEKSPPRTKPSNAKSFRSKGNELLLSSSDDNSSSSDDEIAPSNKEPKSNMLKPCMKETDGAESSDNDSIFKEPGIKETDGAESDNDSIFNWKSQESMTMKPQRQKTSGANSCITKTTCNKENNGNKSGKGKRLSLGSLSSSAASLGSSFATSSDDDSIESTKMNLGRNHKAITQREHSSSPKRKKVDAKSRTYDLSLSSDDDDDHAKDILPKKMSKGGRFKNSKKALSCNASCSSKNSINSESSLESTDSLGFRKKSAVKPSKPSGSNKQQRKLGGNSSFSLDGKKDKSKKVSGTIGSGSKQRKSLLESSPYSLSSKDTKSSPSRVSRGQLFGQNQAKEAATKSRTSNKFLSNRSSSSDSVQIVESGSKMITGKRLSPMCDLSSSDGSEDCNNIRPKQRKKTLKNQHKSSDSAGSIRHGTRMEKESLARDNGPRTVEINNLGWTKSGIGFVKSSAAGGPIMSSEGGTIMSFGLRRQKK